LNILTELRYSHRIGIFSPNSNILTEFEYSHRIREPANNDQHGNARPWNPLRGPTHQHKPISTRHRPPMESPSGHNTSTQSIVFFCFLGARNGKRRFLFVWVVLIFPWNFIRKTLWFSASSVPFALCLFLPLFPSSYLLSSLFSFRPLSSFPFLFILWRREKREEEEYD
jgi:hypothetical protein